MINLTFQRKLEECEQRLHDLENGDPSRAAHSHRALLYNVSHGISRTGVNLKEMAGAVVSAPFDIAKSVRRGVFGSADNISNASDEGMCSFNRVHFNCVQSS